MIIKIGSSEQKMLYMNYTNYEGISLVKVFWILTPPKLRLKTVTRLLLFPTRALTAGMRKSVSFHNDRSYIGVRTILFENYRHYACQFTQDIAKSAAKIQKTLTSEMPLYY